MIHVGNSSQNEAGYKLLQWRDPFVLRGQGIIDGISQEFFETPVSRENLFKARSQLDSLSGSRSGMTELMAYAPSAAMYNCIAIDNGLLLYYDPLSFLLNQCMRILQL